MTTNWFAGVVGFVLLTGCSGPPVDYEGEAPVIGDSVQEQLYRPQSFELIPPVIAGQGSLVTFTAAGDLVGEPREVVIPVLGGYVETRVTEDGWLIVQDLQADLPELAMDSEGFPPNGLVLTGMSLALAEPELADPAWTADGEQGAALAHADLVLEWAVMLSSGDVHPLAPQRIRDVAVEVAFSRAGASGIQLRLAAVHDGVAWRWSDYVELSDLVVDLTGLN